jgi:hypothetical protein
MPETSFNNRLAQWVFGKQTGSFIGNIDRGLFVSQAHNVKKNYARFLTDCFIMI